MRRYRLSAFTLTFFFCSHAIAQIGINTVTPDSSASLHIVSKPSGSGLIIPELTEAQRLAISKPAVGLMVYDLTSKLFYVNIDNTNGNHWFAINPMLTQGNSTKPDVMYASPVVTKLGIGMQPPQIPQAMLDVNGDIHTKGLAVDGFSKNALVPTGSIIMWSGNPLALPAGWALCDGKTYGALVTPDLRGRFIVGAGQNSQPGQNEKDNPNYSAGDKGGVNTYQLKAIESGLPGHTHTSNPHDHGYSWTVNSNDTDKGANNKGGAARADEVTVDDRRTVPTTVTINDAPSQDAVQAHENRPPYFALAYIIKIP